MEIFLAWSGPRSRSIAESLRGWLRDVLQSTEPWMSEEDIAKGQRWSEEIDRHLETAQYGIVCVTPENADSVWLHFEAGALSKAVKGRARVCPYLIGLQKSAVTSPLNIFQMTSADRDDTFRMIQSINTMLKPPLDAERLERCFARLWPDLEAHLRDTDSGDAPTEEQKRPQEEVLDELLTTVRTLRDTDARTQYILAAVEEILGTTRRLFPRYGASALSFYPQFEYSPLVYTRPQKPTDSEVPDRPEP